MSRLVKERIDYQISDRPSIAMPGDQIKSLRLFASEITFPPHYGIVYVINRRRSLATLSMNPAVRERSRIINIRNTYSFVEATCSIGNSTIVTTL